MAVKKEFRDVTVSDFYRSGKSVPMIRVNGLWLEELGFKVGDCVRIKCDNGQLVISLNEEKAQERSLQSRSVIPLMVRYESLTVGFLTL